MSTNLSTSMPQAQSYMINNAQQRRQAGIGQDYVDNYNQVQLAQYNNDYNYWLWQQQMEYNSPSAQVARLKEAGLNPNFNSIDGTGNASSIPASSASLKSNISANKQARVGNILSGVNTMIKMIAEGVGATSDISGIPNDIGLYRDLITKGMQYNVSSSEAKQIQAWVNAAYDAAAKGDLDVPYRFQVPNSIGGIDVYESNPKKSLAYALDSAARILRNDQHKLNLSDLDLKNIEKTIAEKESQYLDSKIKGKELENDWYKVNTGSQVADRILTTIFKGFSIATGRGRR